MAKGERKLTELLRRSLPLDSSSWQGPAPEPSSFVYSFLWLVCSAKDRRIACCESEFKYCVFIV
jgi:hypothetical protein